MHIDIAIMTITDIMITDMHHMVVVTDMSITEETSRALSAQDIGVVINERGFLLWWAGSSEK